jgi:hypothetical protein
MLPLLPLLLLPLLLLLLLLLPLPQRTLSLTTQPIAPLAGHQTTLHCHITPIPSPATPDPLRGRSLALADSRLSDGEWREFGGPLQA